MSMHLLRCYCAVGTMGGREDIRQTAWPLITSVSLGRQDKYTWKKGKNEIIYDEEQNK